MKQKPEHEIGKPLTMLKVSATIYFFQTDNNNGKAKPYIPSCLKTDALILA